ncbi:MAG: TonB family protein [Alphaproteobacteria bacterium]
MDVLGVQATLEGSSTTRTLQADVHSFTMSVQTAVGPKHLDGRGLQGRVVVAYSISADGTLSVARVAQSSGEQRLDSEALQIVRGAAFPTPPNGMSVAHRNFVSAFTFE